MIVICDGPVTGALAHGSDSREHRLRLRHSEDENDEHDENSTINLSLNCEVLGEISMSRDAKQTRAHTRAEAASTQHDKPSTVDRRHKESSEFISSSHYCSVDPLLVAKKNPPVRSINKQ
jgi:hypothetical protein